MMIDYCNTIYLTEYWGDMNDKIAILRDAVSTIKSCEHPNMARIIDFVVHDKRAFIIVNRPRGGCTLDVFLERGLSLYELVRWMIILCDACEFLHNLKPQPYIIVNLNPEGIHIDGYRGLEIIDYGFSFRFPLIPQTIHRGNGYVAPEEYKWKFSPASDVYSIGVIMHNAITRIDPYLQPPMYFPEPRSIDPHFPQVVEDIVMKTLAFKPQERYQTAKELKEKLIALPGHVMNIQLPIRSIN